MTRTLEQGQTLRFDGPGQLRVSAPDNPRIAVAYQPTEGRTLTVLRGPLTVNLASNSGFPFVAALCE